MQNQHQSRRRKTCFHHLKEKIRSALMFSKSQFIMWIKNLVTCNYILWIVLSIGTIGCRPQRAHGGDHFQQKQTNKSPETGIWLRERLTMILETPFCTYCMYSSGFPGVCTHCPGHPDGSHACEGGVGACHLQQGECQLPAKWWWCIIRCLLFRAVIHGPGSKWLKCWPSISSPAANTHARSVLSATHGFSESAETGEWGNKHLHCTTF